MAVSQTDIGNLALTILGKGPISSLTDGSKAATAINTVYDMIRRGMLEGPGTWTFSIKRASLPALATVPVSGPFTTMYALPADYVRALQIGDMYPGLDLSDYRQGPTDADYSIEGKNILCDYGSPLSLQYVFDVTDTTYFNHNFNIALGANIAWTICEELTGSDTKKEEANKRKDKAYRDAAASNALVKAPGFPGDDTWVLARMQ